MLLTSAVPARETGARYLIITHDSFYNSILPLAEWKHKKGMRTHIEKLSQIGTSAVEIRNYIVNAYNTWDIPPEYVLLVGAPNFIELPTVGGTISDNYYTDMNNDLFNDILSGRLTVHDTIEAQTVVNKILLYERTPYLEDTLWFTNACLIANEDYGVYPPIYNDSVYWNDVRHAKTHMLANGYNIIDTLSCGLGNSATDVVQAVNDGRGFVLYRGSAINNWWSPFGVVPDQTANGAKLPIVLSITCCTMGTSSTPAVAEKWLLTGTPTLPRGAAGYFATTTVGGGFITFLRSAICRGFFNALFADGKQTFGQACEGGRRHVYALYSSASEYRGFTTLGDPEMNIWTDTPSLLAVTHPQAAQVGAAEFVVNVRKEAGLSPVSGAVVCITAKSDTTLYAVNPTDAAGNAYFNITPQIVADTLYVTVTGRNLKPYEGSMITFTAGAYVAHLKSSIDDLTGGNNDGMINPGEHINLPLWVKNYGDSIAYDVTGTLRSTDPLVTMTDSVISFGSPGPGDSAFTGRDGYNFEVSQDAPDLHAISFGLECRDLNDSTWMSSFTKVVHAPNLMFSAATIHGGNGNTIFEPGETVTVVVTLRNEGSAGIDTFTAHLLCSSPYVAIIDSMSSYAPIPPESISTNLTDPFSAFSAPGTPTGTAVGFQVIVTGELYDDTLEFSLCIGGKQYYIWNHDLTPAPGANMHSILTNLGYVGDHATTLTAEIDLYGSLWVCLGVWPNNQTISINSPEATALVDYVQDGGCVYMEGGDVWYYDPMGGGHNFCPLFGIAATDDGSDNLGPVAGLTNTFTAGMNFNYGGENNFMDHISPGSANAFLIFRDSNDNYDCAVAYDAGSYRTVGSAFELGLLTDGTPPATRSTLLDSIMHFFGIATGIEEANDLEARMISLRVSPNPFSNLANIRFIIPDPGYTTGRPKLQIYDASGRLVKSFNLESWIMDRTSSISWDGRDDQHRRVSSGVYFIQLVTDGNEQTVKGILLR